jgi:hypothetical protein
MATQEKLIRRKQSPLELAEYLQNISQVCKIHGVSRQHFYDIRKAYEEQDLGGEGEDSEEAVCEESGGSGDGRGSIKYVPYWRCGKIQLVAAEHIRMTSTELIA